MVDDQCWPAATASREDPGLHSHTTAIVGVPACHGRRPRQWWKFCRVALRCRVRVSRNGFFWCGVFLSLPFQLAEAQTDVPALLERNDANRTSEQASRQPNASKLPSNNRKSTEAESAVRQPTREIELHAGHVEIEGPLNRLSLSEGVELTVYRYRVTADRLTLVHTPQGILVEGDGRVSFCPCASSPLTVSFSRATVAPPTDLLLKQTTFRACGVPVFWLPAYWVRSPNKLGLMTPKLAWRATDGPWIGTGAHVPLSSKVDGSDGALELLAGAYLFGGVDLGAQFRSPRNVTSVRWDYRKRGFLELDSKGYRHWDNQMSLSWQVDALRGDRARTGPVTFEAATRNYDRFRTELAYADGRALYSLGLQADVARATSFTNAGQFGPSARWGVGAALGNIGRVDSSLAVLGRMRQSDGANVVALHSADLGFDFRPGPFTVRWVSRERWIVGSGAAQAYDAGLLGSELRAGLPLVAEFGEHRGSWAHWFEPFLVATAAWRGYGPAYGQAAAQPVVTAQVALSNKVWSEASSTSVSLQLRAGSIAMATQQTQATAARWVASGNWLALGGDAGWGGSDNWLSSLRARLGRVDRVAIRSRLEGRGARQPTQIRWLLDEAWSPWNEGWFERQGWMAGGDLDVSFGSQVAVSGGLAYDVGRSSLIAESVGASYRHPCGCFAASSRTSWRVGRNGLDVLLLLELMP